MRNYLLTFDVLRTTEELATLRIMFGDDFFYPIGYNCHAYLVKFQGTSADLGEYLIATQSVYSFEEFFIAEVQRWSASLIGVQKLRIPQFLGGYPEELSAPLAFA
jgi:hypothetical protein